MPQTLEERVTVLEHKIAEYEGSSDFLSDQIKGVHRRLISFEQEVNRRFDSLETRFDSLETRFDSLETRFDSLETRVDRLEQKVDAIIPAVAQVIREELAKFKQ